MSNVERKQVVLDKIRIGMALEFSEEMISDPVFKIEEKIPGMFRAQLRGFLWGKTLPEREAVKYPADWWQAFKARWFPTWALLRWPVLYRRFVVSGSVVYPDLKIALPPHQHQYILSVIDRVDGNPGFPGASEYYDE